MPLLIFASCVPQRKFEDLQKSYEAMAKQNADCAANLNGTQDDLSHARDSLKKALQAKETLERDTTNTGDALRKMNALYGQTNAAYQNLINQLKESEEKNKLSQQELNSQLLETQRKLNEQEVKLTQKESSLKQQSSDLDDLKKQLSQMETDLKAREKKVEELSKVLNQKDSVVNALKNTISDALLSFRDKGLAVSVRNGKVYVSIEDKLLFESGKYSVNTQGKDALLQLSKALNQNPDVNIVVEGHTDNVPYKGTGVIKDNWDLSVLRATEVARILNKDGKVDGKRISAAGRGDTSPIASNDTPEGRAKNRRTEVILTPKLTELFKVLGQD
jgi:chemotaxis protein MotB